MEVESVNVTQKDIENLSQLDRIEYKLELKRIKESINFFSCSSMISKLILITGIIALLIHYLFGGLQSYPELLNLIEKLLKAFMIFLPIGFVFDLISIFVFSEEKRKLNLKFFKNKNKREEKWLKKKKK